MKAHFLIIPMLILFFIGATFGRAESANGGLRIISELTPPSTMLLHDGRLGGFGVEVVEALKKELGSDVKIEIMPWARGYKYLTEHPNILLFPTTRTAEREDLFHWVGPIASIEWIFFGNKNKKYNIKSLDDAKKISGIGVYRGDARAVFLKKKGFTNLEVMDSQEANFKKLLRNRIDLVASSNIGIRDFFIKDKKLRQAAIPVFTFRKVDLYLAFSKGTNMEIIEKWRKAFESFKAKGGLKRVHQKWL